MPPVAPANESMDREAKPEDTLQTVAKLFNVQPVFYNTPTIVREQVNRNIAAACRATVPQCLLVAEHDQQGIAHELQVLIRGT